MTKRKKIPARFRYWFKDGIDVIQNLNEKFMPLGHLMSRLLAQEFDSKRIKFINHQLNTEKTYFLFPQSEKNYLHEGVNEIWYNDCFDLQEFLAHNENTQKKILWERAYKAFIASKKKEVKEAFEKAYSAGLDANLEYDYNILEIEFNIQNEEYLAALRISFEEDSKNSTLIVYKSNSQIYSRHIDESDLGNPFFLEMYNSIEVNSDQIIIKGDSDIDYLPLKISFREIGLI